MGDSMLYRLFGKDPPLYAYVSSETCVFADVSLSDLYRLRLETAGRSGKLKEFMRGYDVPWSPEQFARLRPSMLSESEKLELHLLLALAISPRFLFVDELFSPFGMDTTQRMTANLQRWCGNTNGLALIASSRFYGFMDAFQASFLLEDGKLRLLDGSQRKAAAVGVPAEAAEPVLGSHEPSERDATLVFGEFFYRHHRVTQDNPHFGLKAVLENALLVRIKGTLDGTLEYLRELGLDPIRIDFSPAQSREDLEELDEETSWQGEADS